MLQTARPDPIGNADTVPCRTRVSRPFEIVARDACSWTDYDFGVDSPHAQIRWVVGGWTRSRASLGRAGVGRLALPLDVEPSGRLCDCVSLNRERNVNRRKVILVLGAGFVTVGATAAAASYIQRPKATRPPRLLDDIYFDDDGLIVQADGDGGTAAQREGMYWFARAMRERGEELKKQNHSVFQPWRTRADYTRVMNLLEFKENGRPTGRFIRHPRQGSHNDPAMMSRDQLLPLVAAMSVWDDQERLTRVADALGRPEFFSFLEYGLDGPIWRIPAACKEPGSQ